MIALVLAALLSGRDIVFVKADLPFETRWQAIAVEVVQLLGENNRIAVVDANLRILADFSNRPEAIRYAILETDITPGERIDPKDKLFVLATHDRKVQLDPQIALPALVLDTNKSGAPAPGIVTAEGIEHHRGGSLRDVARLMPEPKPEPKPQPQQQQPPQEQPHELAKKLFVDAMRRLHDGDEEGVEAILDEVLANDPLLADAWYERGMLAAARDDHEAAERDLRKYLALAPRGKHAGDAREFLDALQGVRPR